MAEPDQLRMEVSESCRKGLDESFHECARTNYNQCAVKQDESPRGE